VLRRRLTTQRACVHGAVPQAGCVRQARLTGRSGRLAALLREAVTTRWQAHAAAVGALIPLPRARVEQVLRTLHRDYQATAAGTLSWTGGAAAEGAAARGFLAGLPGRFWELSDEA
jgi:hypothetical protein